MKAIEKAVWLTMCLLMLSMGSSQAQESQQSEAAGEGSVLITIEGLASTKGLIYISLYLTSDGFPAERNLAFGERSVAANLVSNGSVMVSFPSVPAGSFAVSVLHDEDADGEMDTNFLGIPKEDYGFSRNPKSRFGPPPFEKAALNLAAGEEKQLVVTLK